MPHIHIFLSLSKLKRVNRQKKRQSIIQNIVITEKRSLTNFALNGLIIGGSDLLNKSILLKHSIKSSHLTSPLENSIEYTVFSKQHFLEDLELSEFRAGKYVSCY